MDKQHSREPQAFTLIELLIVIAVIAILSIVVVLTLNPAEMLRRGRDSNRVSDLDTLTHAISLYQEDQGTVGGQGSLGTSTIIYTSLPDSSSTCGSWNLPSPPSGYAYQCAPSSTYRSTNGSGWIPLNLSTITTGSPLGQLPIDPTNSSSTGLYYTYVTNGSQYEVTSLFESAQYKSQYAASPVIQNYPEVNAKGSNLTINPLWSTSGLVGYWPLTEGTGTTAFDQSGNGNMGIWYGTLGSQYAIGKVGPWAGSFDGTDNYVMTQSSSYYPSYTLSEWVKGYLNSQTAGSNIYGLGWNGLVGMRHATGGSSPVTGVLTTNSDCATTLGTQTSTNHLDGNWHLVTITTNSTAVQVYLDGSLNTSGTISSSCTTAKQIIIGAWATSYGYLNGLIDDVRIYNRALSGAEVQSLYNAEK